MILKIAWRNIWRNSMRSIVVIASVSLGLLAAIFVTSFYKGVTVQKVNDVIKLEMSHLQIHIPGFRDDYLPADYLNNAQEIKRQIQNKYNVKAIALRSIAMGMLSSPTKGGAVKIIGVDPVEERKTTTLYTYIKEGSYFEGGVKHPVVVSRKQADKYNLSLKSKVVVTVQDVDGEIVSGAFRVVGIFETDNGMYDEANVLVVQTDLNQLLSIPDRSNEIAVLFEDHDDVNSIADELQLQYPSLEVKSWMDLSTGMRFLVEAMDTYMVVIVGIVLLALLFGIINTMLMSVLERTREIGMLISIGMSNIRVFSMIVIETIILAVTGGPLGLLFSWLTVKYFSEHGIDLGPFRETYMDLGFAPVIYPVLEPHDFYMVAIMVVLMAIIAALFPAMKALKLKPSESLRKI